MRTRLISYRSASFPPSLPAVRPRAARKLSFGVTQIADAAAEAPNKNVSYERRDNKEGRDCNFVTSANPVKIHDAELAHYDLQMCKIRERARAQTEINVYSGVARSRVFRARARSPSAMRNRGNRVRTSANGRNRQSQLIESSA